MSEAGGDNSGAKRPDEVDAAFADIVAHLLQDPSLAATDRETQTPGRSAGPGTGAAAGPTSGTPKIGAPEASDGPPRRRRSDVERPTGGQRVSPQPDPPTAAGADPPDPGMSAGATAASGPALIPPKPSSVGDPTRNAGWEDVAPPEPTISPADEATLARESEPRWIPPDPQLAPGGDVINRFAWAGVLGGPAFLMLGTLLGAEAGGTLATVALFSFITGFITLVVRMKDRTHDDGPDDGAVI